MSDDKEPRDIPINDIDITSHVWQRILSLEQLRRIGILSDTFREVTGWSLDEWIAVFRQDAAVEREMSVWEKMAEAYRWYLASRTLVLKARKEVYSWLLTLTLMPPDKAAKAQPWKHLSAEDRKILCDYHRQVCERWAHRK